MVDEKPKEEVKKEEAKPEFQVKLEEMKVENERMEKNISEIKELKAFDALSGKADAGQPPEKKEEQSPEDYSKDLMAGKIKADAT